MSSLVVRVISGDGPLAGRRVSCVVLGGVLGVADTHCEAYTGPDGTARFEDLPPGAIHVYVDGQRALMLRLARDASREVTVRRGQSGGPGLRPRNRR
jgi:hypothetical protein